MRILDADKHAATQRLQQGCTTLADKVEQLNGLVGTYLEILDKQVCQISPSSVSQRLACCVAAHILLLQAGKIEVEKLKAIGVRNAVATLEEVSAVANAVKHTLWA